MIIKSRLHRTPYHRRTSIAEPGALTLESIIGTLLAQWDLADESTSPSEYALVVSQGQDEKLLIDKEAEWALFCEESKAVPVTQIDVELEPRRTLLQLTSQQAASPTNTGLRKTVSQLEQEVQRLPQQRQEQTQDKFSQPGSDSVPAHHLNKPKHAFLSVDPQPIKNRRDGASSGSATAEQNRAGEQAAPRDKDPAVATSTASAPPPLTLDEIMARSRLQGEGLNQLFGNLQARSAGRQTDHQSHMSAHANADVDPAGGSSPAADPVEEATSGPQVSSELDMRGVNQSNTSSTSPPPARRTAEEVGNVNHWLDNAWQERLAQMGHGPESGSHYARLRTDKLKETEGEGQAGTSGAGPHDDSMILLTASESAAEMSSSMTSAGNGASSRSPLHALDEELEDVSPQPANGITFPSTHSDQLPSLGRATESPLDERPGSSSGVSLALQEVNSFKIPLRSKLFKRRRRGSDGPRSFSQQNSGRATPDGAMTPRSLNNAIFRRRPLSVRSLSDALIGTAREQAHQNVAETGDGSATRRTDRPMRSRHNPIRSLSEINLLPHSLRRRRASGQSLPGEPTERRFVNESNDAGRSEQCSLSVDILKARDADRERLSGQLLRCGQGTGQVNVSPIERDQQHVEASRPSLLRAAHSTPLSSTAVNLSPAGGITLHVSSVASPAFTRDEDKQQHKPVSWDAERPAPTAKPMRNLFDLMLPREIRLKCMQALVNLHDDEILQDQLTNRTALCTKDRTAAMRELVRLSRVSRTWQSLTLDGQLWSTLDVSTASGISDESLLRIVRTAGPFVKRISLRNMQNLSSPTFMTMCSPPSLAAGSEVQAIPFNRGRSKSDCRLPTTMASLAAYNIALPSLTHLNLQGCRSLSTEALHHALVRMPQLQHLNLSSSPSVSNDTCLILGASLPHLMSLNISRCPKVTGDGLIRFIDAAQGCLYDRALFTSTAGHVEAQNIALDLQELQAMGLHDVDADLMDHLGRALRNLRVLDLSYAGDMTDEAIAAFVRHPGPHRTSVVQAGAHSSLLQRSAPSGPFVTLTARQAGGNLMVDESHFRRIHANLVRISFSSCRSLTDRSCMHLAHAVPKLKCLELANIGNTLRDDGLAKLLDTTPDIERIDVEGAMELGDKFLQAITPPIAYIDSLSMSSVATSEHSSGRISRRPLRRARAGAATASQGGHGSAALPLQGTASRVTWSQSTPTGANLTHLIISHLNRLEPASLLTVVRRCPKLIHLEVDDTRANDTVLNEFVSHAHQRRLYGAYVSMVDCRALTKGASTEVFASGRARPRAGQVGDEYAAFYYDNGTVPSSFITTHSSPFTLNRRFNAARNEEGSNVAASTSTSANSGPDGPANECDGELVVVKTFWAWQAVDVRVRNRRKAEAKRETALAKCRRIPAIGADPFKHGARGRDPLTAALGTYISRSGHSRFGSQDGEDNANRWSRFTSGLLSPGDEDEDARTCTIM